MGGWKKAGLLMLTFVLLAAVFTAVFPYLAVSAPERVIIGVRLAGKDLSACRREEVKAAVMEWKQARERLRLTLLGPAGRRTVRGRDLGLTVDEEKTVAAALAVGRRGPWYRRWWWRQKAYWRGCDVQPLFHFQKETLARLARELQGDLPTEPRDARFVEVKGEVKVEGERIGYRPDLTKLAAEVERALREGKEKEIKIAYLPLYPEVREEKLRKTGITELVAEYTTRFDPSQVDRVYNIRMAAKALDNLLIGPGETVSFNEKVGPREEEKGYRKAPVIVNDEIVPGTGGGVCQVSSTLYNAVLLAGLEIKERTSHSLPVAYVPPGRDATVDFGRIDLKFANPTCHWFLIKTRVEGDTLQVKIFGPPGTREEVTIFSEVVEVIPPEVVVKVEKGLRPGEVRVKEEGQEGMRVRTWRVRRRGKEEIREELPASYYHPRPRILVTGS